MRILIIIAALSVAACTGGANEPAAGRPDTVRSPGKPLHPIQVRAIVNGPLRAGRETEASLAVTSSRPVQAVEVTLQPALATIISENHFARRFPAAELEPSVRTADRNLPMEFRFRVRPASDAPQPVRVLVRVTGTDGRVLTREVTLALANREKSSTREKPRNVTVEDLPEPAGDVIVPAQQEVRRGN